MWTALLLICAAGTSDCQAVAAPRSFDSRDECLYTLMTLYAPDAMMNLRPEYEVKDAACFGWGERVADSRGSS
jgi:hypothetical protein